MNADFTTSLAQGRMHVGLWVSLASNFAAEVVAPAGYDWVLLDMEHSPGDLGSILGQLQVFAATDTAVIVRPDWNDAVLVKKLLDLGAPGLLFPMIQTPEEARAAVAATRYPPRGIRGVSGSTRANQFGRNKDYYATADDKTAVLLQIESLTALVKAQEIAAVDGVNGIFFGPADIAADMGHIGAPMHPEVWAAIRPVARQLMSIGMPCGTLVNDAAFAAELLREGFSFVACGADAGLLAKAADTLLADVKSAL